MYSDKRKARVPDEYDHVYDVFHHKATYIWCRIMHSASPSSAQHTVVEGQAHHSLLVAAVFPLDLAGLHTPQTSQVV